MHRSRTGTWTYVLLAVLACYGTIGGEDIEVASVMWQMQRDVASEAMLFVTHSMLKAAVHLDLIKCILLLVAYVCMARCPAWHARMEVDATIMYR